MVSASSSIPNTKAPTPVGLASAGRAASRPRPRATHARVAERAAAVVAIAAAAFGIAVLAGWWVGVPALTPTKANTALAFVLGSAGLWLTAHRSERGRRLRVALGGIVTSIGLITLLQYATGLDLGIDELLAKDTTAGEGQPPGRMGINTAVMLSSLGLGFVLGEAASARWRLVSDGALVVAVAACLLGLVGHVFGVPELYAGAHGIEIAVRTALVGIALATALLVVRTDRGLGALLTSDLTGGMFARRLIPVIVAAPILVVWATQVGVEAGVFEPGFAMAIDITACIGILLAVGIHAARHVDRLDVERRGNEQQIREMLRELARHAGDLQQSNQELEAFSYSVSHDLRAPIRHISGFAELLDKRARTGLDDKSRDYLSKIVGSAQRAGVLIDDLLAFSRMGRVPLRTAVVDLDEVVADAWRDLAMDRRDRHVDLVVHPLPPAHGDPALLKVAFHNLLENALKYSAPREHARIEIGARDDGDGSLTVYIQDNGVGFDMAYVDKLFGVFQRLHGQEFEGVGIGLANVKRIVQRHGGRVWADGRVDGGATFYLSLPKATRGEPS